MKIKRIVMLEYDVINNDPERLYMYKGMSNYAVPLYGAWIFVYTGVNKPLHTLFVRLYTT